MQINKDIVEGKWKEIKGKIRQKWAELTDDEISKMKGTEEELSGALQKKYGYKKEEASQHIKDFMDKNLGDENNSNQE